jgi:iron complex outermembrane receptor protein
LSGAALQDAGITRLEDISDRIPGLDLNSGNGVNGDVNPFIRGVGQRETKITVDSGVGIYIDGIYLSRSPAMLGTSDLAGIEVLRGPAGTLFGKNTTGGAIIYHLNKPDQNLGAELSLRAGNEGRLNGEAIFNLPLGEKAALRASVSQVKSDGYVHNPIDGDDYNYDDRLTGTAQLRWYASDTVTVDLLAAIGKTRQQGRLGNCADYGSYGSLGGFANNNPSIGEPSLTEACALISAEAGTDLGAHSMPGGEYRVDDDLFAATITWDIGSVGGVEELQFKSISSYRNLERSSDEDIDGTSLSIVDNFEFYTTETDAYSQEFQLSGALMDNRMRFITGLYYFAEEAEQPRALTRVGPSVLASFPAQSLGFADGTAWLALIGQSSELTRETDNEALAWFGQINFDISEQLELTLGVRYTDETREAAFTNNLVNPADTVASGQALGAIGAVTNFVQSPASCADTGQYCDALSFNYDVTGWTFPTPDGAGYAEGKVEIDEWTPLASLAYSFSDEVLGDGSVDSALLYFTYSEGFRSGGIVNQANLLRVGEVNTFDPEFVTNYELGFKLDAFDNSLRLNGAFYFMDYEDQQLTVTRIDPDTGSPVPTVTNAGKSEIGGAELELTWLATDQLQIMGSFSYIDAEYTEFDDFINGADGTPVPVDRSDEAMPNVAEQQIYLGAEYHFDLGDAGSLVPRLETSYKSEIYRGNGYTNWITPEARELTTSDEPWFVSARLTWRSANNRLLVALWGTNLTDEDDYYVGGIPGIDFKGVVNRIYAEPRMYGIDARYTWGD